MFGATAAMMADNVEHVISYWMMFQRFHSPALGGFAVISHWVPYLLFAGFTGGLADRFDIRRLIQVGMLLFMGVSVSWGVMFLTDSVTLPMAMLLLVIHGLAGVIWLPASQVLIHQIVTPEQLPSAVRLNATGRYLGFVVGPALGGALLLGLGPAYGIFVNALIYAPLFVWLIRAPYGFAAPGWRPPRSRHRRSRRCLVDHASGGAQSNSAVHDRPDRCGLVLCRQCVSGANARICARPGPRAGGFRLSDAARGRCRRRACRGTVVGDARIAQAASAHRLSLGHDMVLRAGRLRAHQSLCARDRAAVFGWIHGTRVQFDGAGLGANQRAGRDSRPRDRRVLDVGVGPADVQRPFRRTARRKYRHSQFTGAERRGVVGPVCARCSRCATGGVPDP